MTDRAEWLEWRRGGIGASDVPGILGISPWSSPYSVWVDKMGLSLDDDMNEQQMLGLALEPAINELFHQRTGLYVAGSQTRVVHPDMPWARATLDGYVSEILPWSILSEPIPWASIGNFEAKTTKDSPRVWEAAIPDMYAAQVQWQMFVTGAEHTWLGVLHASFGLSFRVYEVARDDIDIGFIVGRVLAFYQDHVATGVAPEADGSMATTEALHYIPANPDAQVELEDFAEDLTELRYARARLKDEEARIAQYENQIKAAMGECTEGMIDGNRVASWRSQERRTFDVARLRLEQPEVAAGYESTASSRVFRLANKKEM